MLSQWHSQVTTDPASKEARMVAMLHDSKAMAVVKPLARCMQVENTELLTMPIIEELHRDVQ